MNYWRIINGYNADKQPHVPKKRFSRAEDSGRSFESVHAPFASRELMRDFELFRETLARFGLEFKSVTV